MGKFCFNCNSYEAGIFTREGEKFGICQNTAVKTQLAMDGGSVLGEDGVIYAAEYFGCIYWREKAQVLIDLSEVVDVKKILQEKLKKEENGE